MKKLTLLALLIFLLCHIAQSQPIAARIDSAMNVFHRNMMFDGSVIVVDKGKVIYKKSFGLANREWNIPNTSDTRFMIGSISKQFTAMLALLQIQKGKLRLDGKLKEYIPEFTNKNTENITVEQLMKNTAGFANYEIITDFFPRISRQFFTPADYIKIYKDSALISVPGTEYHYSSWGFFTLGYLVERVSGKTYSQLLKEEIFSKLGMTGSGEYAHMQVVPKRASGYEYFLDQYQSADFRDQSNAMGTGNIYSTVEDLYKWSQGIDRNILLNKELTEKMFTPGMGTYGYGWFIYWMKLSDGDSVRVQGHAGQTDGFISMISRLPESNSFVAFLCNGNPAPIGKINQTLIGLLQGKKIQVKVPVAKVVAPTITKNGVKAAIQQIDKLKDDPGYEYNWEDMDDINKQLITAGKLEDALALAEKNALDFPDHQRIHNSIGYVYFKMGRYEDAKREYQLTIKKYPQNGEALAMLANSLLK